MREWEPPTRTCPICKKKFIFNNMSIYKTVKRNTIRWYCSYTCWRKSGGDNDKMKGYKKIQEELAGKVRINKCKR